MRRFTCSALALSILVCACQRAPEPAQTQVPDDAQAAVTADAAATPAASPPAPFVPFDTTPIGIDSCDAFIAEANRCFANSKQHPSTAVILRPGFEEQFRQWRSMKDSPSYASSLKAVCDSQMQNGLAGMKDGLRCE